MATPPKQMITTAGCIIIADEVLSSKTVDTNSAWFGKYPKNKSILLKLPFPAKYCFELGIELRRVEVIGDDESEIVEAVRRMSSSYDFVVTSGGLGGTHDDIT